MEQAVVGSYTLGSKVGGRVTFRTTYKDDHEREVVVLLEFPHPDDKQSFLKQVETIEKQGELGVPDRAVGSVSGTPFVFLRGEEWCQQPNIVNCGDCLKILEELQQVVPDLKFPSLSEVLIPVRGDTRS